MNVSFCENCDVKKANFHCKNCFTNFCQECSELHPKIKATRDHIVELKEIDVDISLIHEKVLSRILSTNSTFTSFIHLLTSVYHYSRIHSLFLSRSQLNHSMTLSLIFFFTAYRRQSHKRIISSRRTDKR